MKEGEKMQVKFAKIASDPLKLDKRPDFEAASPVEKSVQISAPINTEKPHFVLNVSGDFDYNYAYVSAWGRYYFIGEPTYLDGNRLTVSGECDVLTSNADEIKQLTINIRRSTNKANKRISDPLRPVQSNRQCETIRFNDCGLIQTPSAYSTNIVYVLTVQGGAHR